MKMVFDSMWHLLSGQRFGQPIAIESVAQARMLFAVYAIGFTAISTEIFLLNWRAWHLREALRLNAFERKVARGEMSGWLIPMATGLAALVLAFTLPRRNISWSGWVYFSMAIVVPLHSAARRRALRKICET